MESHSVSGVVRQLFGQVVFSGPPASGPPAAAWVRTWPGLLVVLVWPAVLLYPTLDFHLLEPDEGRYAQIPWEMLSRGEWVVPRLHGEAYLDKPPLMYWLTAASYAVFGVSAAAARLVPAVCVHLTIMSVYVLGRRSVGERSALWAAGLLSLAPGFVSVARLLLLDGLLTLCVTLSLLCGFEAVRTGRFRAGWWLAAAVASGLGFLTKGPIAEVLLFVPLWIYGWLMRGHAEQPARVGLRWYAAFGAVVAAVNLPWYVAIYLQEPQFLTHFFWKHNVQRFLQPFDHLEPVWYYVPIVAAGLLPGTVPLLCCLGRWCRLPATADAARPSAAAGFWLLAGVWCLVFFSCSGSKLPTYILPAYPALGLGIGQGIVRSGWDRRWGWWLGLCLAGGGLLLLHHGALPYYARERSPYGRPERVEHWVAAREVPVITFPRYCNSLSFYVRRADWRSYHTREVNQLYVACHHAPRTVILFTHRQSLAGFRSQLPPSLEIVETVSLRRTYGYRWLDALLGDTPWGLCDLAVVVPRYQVPPATATGVTEPAGRSTLSGGLGASLELAGASGALRSRQKFHLPP